MRSRHLVGGSALALAFALASGCEGLRRAALKTIDAKIQQQPRWERERSPGGYRLGPYAVVIRSLREHAIGQDLGRPTDGPRNPGWRYELELELRGPARSYIAHCTGHRIPTIVADYGEIADVANDQVSIACAIEGEHRWTFTSEGRLDKNIGGELRRADEPSAAPCKVEIVMWLARLKLFRRHLNDPVAQVRKDGRAVAAMVIARPEWAWVEASAPSELQGVGLTTLAAIRALPLGFEE